MIFWWGLERSFPLGASPVTSEQTREILKHVVRKKMYSIVGFDSEHTPPPLKELVDHIHSKVNRFVTFIQVCALSTSNFHPISISFYNFVQIGACDGNSTTEDDELQDLLKESFMAGLMVEPVPSIFNNLKKRVKNLDALDRIYAVNAAIVPLKFQKNRNIVDGSLVEFFVVNEKFRRDFPRAPHWLKYQLGSLDRNHILKHFHSSNRKIWSEKYIEQIRVPVMSPGRLLQRFGELMEGLPVDILMVDAEGYDSVVCVR